MSSHLTYRQFDFQSVFNSTKQFIDGYNRKQDKLTDKLNANHRATAELIIRLYLKQLNGLSKSFVLSEEQMPGFKTFNPSLASCKGCTSRTIINHKERLKRSGFIIKEEHLGAQGIELWINPEILKFGQKAVQEMKGDFLKIQSETTSFSSIGKNFHPLVHEPHEQDNNNSIVDSVKGVLPQKRDHGGGLSKDEPSRTSHERYKNTVENAKSASNNQKNVSVEVDRISLLVFAQQFWQFARSVLFPDLILSDPEERDIMNKIWASVYHKFNDQLTNKQWLEYHEQALERLVMVRKWLGRSPANWIPRPDIYFHPNNNKNGFKVTQQWLIKREILKLELRRQLEYQKIKHEQKLHADGRGRYKDLSRLQLFRTHELRLKKLKDPSLLEAYYLSLKQINHSQILKPHDVGKSN